MHFVLRIPNIESSVHINLDRNQEVEDARESVLFYLKPINQQSDKKCGNDY
jgi:hypothetical protein